MHHFFARSFQLHHNSFFLEFSMTLGPVPKAFTLKVSVPSVFSEDSVFPFSLSGSEKDSKWVLFLMKGEEGLLVQSLAERAWHPGKSCRRPWQWKGGLYRTATTVQPQLLLLLLLVKLFPYASMYITGIALLNHHGIIRANIITAFYRWGNWRLQRPDNLP